MNPPPDPKLTAWALNELSPEERETFEAELMRNSELRGQAKVTQDFCRFISSHLQDETIALTDAQRSYVTAATAPQRQTRVFVDPQFAAKAKPQAPRFDRDAWWRQPALILPLSAAAVLILGSLYYVSDYGATQKSSSALKSSPTVASRTAGEGAMAKTQSVKPTEPKERESLVAMAETKSTASSDAYRVDDIRGNAVVGQSSGKPTAPVPARDKAGMAVHLGKNLDDKSDIAGAKIEVNKGTALGKTGGASMTLNGSNTFAGSRRLSGGTLTAGGAAGAPAGGSSAGGATAPGKVAENAPHPLAPGDPLKRGVAVNTTTSPISLSEVTAAPTTPAPQTAGRELAQQIAPAPAAKAKAESAVAFARSEIAGKKLADLEEMERSRTVHLGQQLTAREAPSGESYAPIVENSLVETAREPLSTFSIDVDTAAYANIRRFLNTNTRPPRDAVRIEELINYFPYDYELPDRADRPFSVQVDIAEAPWQPMHRLARIGIKGREINLERKPGNFVFLVDVSGSMNEPGKLPLVQMSLGLLADRLTAADRVAIVTYAGDSGLALPSTSGDRKTDITRAIDRMKAGGSTHGSEGIVQAYDETQKNFIKDGINRVILCTDGDFNVGVTSPQELEKLIAAKAKDGVFLSVLGFGTGNIKDTIMETLADKGNGNYAYIDSLSEARKVLIEQMQGTLITIAKDVKIQVEFNPAAVRAYRLIGYENRVLAKEDFNNDTRDAGEIGAGHTVTALYEIVPLGAATPEGRPVVDSLKYQSVPAIQPTEASKSGEVMTVKLRYKQPEGKVSQLIEVPVKDDGKSLANSPLDFKFATAVAGFGLLLRDSSYKGALTWEQVRRLAQEGKGSDPNGYRGEFIQLVDKARGIMGGGEP